MHRGPKHHDDLKNLLTTLDIGSHINAGPQLLPKAGAERSEAEAGGSQVPGKGTGYPAPSPQIRT